MPSALPLAAPYLKIPGAAHGATPLSWQYADPIQSILDVHSVYPIQSIYLLSFNRSKAGIAKFINPNLKETSSTVLQWSLIKTVFHPIQSNTWSYMKILTQYNP